MAITTQNPYLDNAVIEDFAPAGHTVATTAAVIGDVDVSVRGYNFEVTASASAGAAKAAAFDDLIDTELVAVIDAYIAAVAPGLGINTTTHTVQYNARVRNITRGDEANDILLSDANVNYIIKVDLEVALS